MYGLPQAGIIAQKLLEKRLEKHGCSRSKITPSFWAHKWRPISFSLVVDNFGIKYVGKDHDDHLIAVLEEDYELKKDWDGDKYVSILLDWDYDRYEVHLSMPGYVEKALQRFKHELGKKKQEQPYEHAKPNYGAKVQYETEEDSLEPLEKEEKTWVQQVLGTFLYYGQAVDGTMLCSLSAITMDQENPTQIPLKKH